MKIKNDVCSVTISVDETYTFNSADPKKYDIVFNPDNYENGDYFKALKIHIDTFSKAYTILLIGNYYYDDTNSAVLEGDILTVLHNEDITQLRVTDGSIIQRVHIPTLGTNFAIYKVSAKYIIHGEIDIICLDDKFNKLWSFSGRDIWYSCTNKNPFEICSDRIKLYDFYDNYYEIDFEGKLLMDKTSDQWNKLL